MSPRKSAVTVALGKAIRSVRQERGLSQEACASRLDIDRSYFGAIERGEVNISLETLVKVAYGLDMTAARLCSLAKI